VFNEVLKQNENAVLLFVGDGELRTQIESQINNLGMADKVILTGVVPNVNEYLQAMDVFVFPSKFEGLGIVAIEAQAAGLYCVVADTVPQEAFITDLIEKIPLSKGAKAWAEVILQYTNHKKKNTLKEIKAAGFDIVEKATELEKFYQSIYSIHVKN